MPMQFIAHAQKISITEHDLAQRRREHTVAASHHGTTHRVTTALAALVLAATVSGCSVLPWWNDDPGEKISVFDLEVGDCTITPQDVTVEVTDLTRVDCSVEHQQEVFAVLPYVDPATDERPSTRPDEDALNAFADGACAAAFEDYVGVDYRDSDLFFTYLLPSTRGWEQNDDNNVVCFITTTGAMLTQSAKSTNW